MFNAILCLLQVRFALTSASIFSRTDKVTDSETFYTSIYDLLADPLETKEVQELLAWWNKYVGRSIRGSLKQTKLIITEGSFPMSRAWLLCNPLKAVHWTALDKNVRKNWLKQVKEAIDISQPVLSHLLAYIMDWAML